MRTTTGNISSCGVEDVIAASSIASVHFCPCPRVRELPSRSRRVHQYFWSGLLGLVRLAVYRAWVDRVVRLEFAFGVLWDVDAANPRLRCCSPVCVRHESAVWWLRRRFRRVPGPPTFDLRACSSSLNLQPSFSCFGLSEVAHDFGEGS